MIVHDVASYIEQNLPRPQFYIDSLLEKEGSLLLYGAPGVRKSWLVEYMAFCIATGTDFLNFGTTQARVLLVNFEISSLGYHWRLKSMARNFALEQRMFYELSPSAIPLDEREAFENLAGIIRPISPKVIILDCLASCFSGDENSSRDVSKFLFNVVELKREHDASVIIVHHANKNPLATSMDKSRGHTKLTGWADTCIYMVEQPSGIQLQFGKVRQSPRERIYPLNVEFVDYKWRIRRRLGGEGGQQGDVEGV